MYVARHVAVGIQLFTATAARIARTCAAGPPHAGKKRIKRGMFRPVAIPPPRVRGKRTLRLVIRRLRRITPAYAGKTIQLCFKHRPTRRRVSFFIDDYQFERFWNDPYPNIERLREFPCALTPDFSLYMDIPMAIKIGMCIALGLLVRRCRMPT